ncbi:MAG: alcohol dehydrogenase catalytic domain-containing protein [Planctomycetes bacterium]|nr:alcohol dehydrogenase catalytic domain-containing protein [Planctomycetota bacterium]
MQTALYAGNKSINVVEHTPEAPAPGEVRLRVAYCGICGTDVHIFHGKMDARVKIPQPIGHEISGVIEAVGEGVSGFAEGDHVTVRPLAYADKEENWKREGSHIRPGVKFMGIDTPGAYQYSWNVPANTLHKLPQELPLDIAALVEPLAVACHDIRIGKVKAGEQVVVLGGGPIGMLIALVSREAGAEVLVSEINPFRLKVLGEMGIDTVNPKEADVEAVVKERTGGIGADVVFEVTGVQAGVDVMTKLPCVRGRMVVVGIFSEPPKVDLFQFFWKELQLFGARVYEAEDFDTAIALAAKGTLPLEKIVSLKVELDGLQGAFEEISRGGNLLKVLVKCS